MCGGWCEMELVLDYIHPSLLLAKASEIFDGSRAVPCSGGTCAQKVHLFSALLHCKGSARESVFVLVVIIIG